MKKGPIMGQQRLLLEIRKYRRNGTDGIGRFPDLCRTLSATILDELIRLRREGA